ncbi:MAG: O-antigen ligase family protein [Lentisphaeria bacterium]|nr:O-antigen ligase family protein [Lentisphaeria bacterium]
MLASIPPAILLLTAVLAAGLVPGAGPAAACAAMAAAILRPFPRGRRFRVLWWCVAALFLWVVVTLLPLGSGGGGAFRREQWDALRGFADAAEDLLPGAEAVGDHPRLTLNRDGTLRWLFLATGAWALFLYTASLRLPGRLLLLKAMVAVGAAVAVSGVVFRIVDLPADRVLGWYPVADLGGGTPLGPFVNRNHFAAFCALLAPLALTLAAAPSRHPVLFVRGRRGLRQGLYLTTSPAERLACLLALVVLGGAVLFSRSRGGTGALLLGISLCAFLWLRSGRSTALLAALGAVGAFLLVVWWPDPALQSRFHGMRDPLGAVGARWDVWNDAIRLWARLPLAGAGLNAFRVVSPGITSWATLQEATHAESEAMQWLAETGVVGVLLAGVVGAGWLVMSWGVTYAGARHLFAFDMWDGGDESPEEPSAVRSEDESGGVVPFAFAAAAWAGLGAMGFQCLVDIPSRIPLAAWATACVAGLIAPLPTARRRGARAVATWMWPERLLSLLALCGLLAVCWWRPGWRALYRDRISWLEQAQPGETLALLDDVPTYWQAWYELGDRLGRPARNPTETPPAPDAPALSRRALERALQCSPRNPTLRSNLAWRLWHAGSYPDARIHRDASLALVPDDRRELQSWLQAEWAAGFPEEAHGLVRRLLEQDECGPEAVAAVRVLASREIAAGSTGRARELVLAALRVFPDEAQLLTVLAACEKRLGYGERERQALRHLVACGGGTAAQWWRLAELHRELGEKEALQEALGMATRLDPRRRRAADELWRQFLQQSKPESGGSSNGAEERR